MADITAKALQEFDYIIVGAGSAGCVLAGRLSEDPNLRVALLAAGGLDDAPEISMPVAFPQLFKTKYDWDFATEPEQSLRERRIYLPRGRTLGGSSAMNADAEADIVAFIEQQMGTNYHPTCTCAIGRVVDPDLRVFGTEGLRVVDASVMPSIVRGNSNAAVIAIAEKATDILQGNGPVEAQHQTQARTV